MNLKSVSLTNLKGVTATYPLSPITIITGDNASGKSAIQNAIQVGLQGYHARLGKQHSATFSLAGDRKLAMGTGLDFGDGVSKTCCWTPKSDGTVSFKENVFGGVTALDPVMLDFSEYQTKTGKERIAYAFKQLRVDEERVKTRLREACGAIEVVPSQNAARLEMMAVLEHQIKSNPNIQLALEGLIAEYESRKKGANQLAKQTGQALLRMTLMSPAPVDCLEALNELQESERAVAGEAGAIAQQINNVMALQREYAALQQTKSLPGDVLDQIATLTALTAAFQDTVEAKQSVLARITSDYRTEKAKLDAIRIQQDGVMERLADIKDSPTCHTCGAKKAGWKEAAQKELNEELAKISGDRAKIEIEMCRLEQAGKTARTTVESAKKDRFDHEANQSKLLGLKAARDQASHMDERLQDMARRLSEAGDPEAMKARQIAIQQRQQLLTQKRAELFAIQTAFNSNQDMKRRRADTEREQLGHHATAEVSGKFLTVVSTVQQEVLNETFGQLLNVANLFCDGILDSPLVYRDGEIGKMKHDTFIACNQVLFSGFEQRLAFMALQVALASTGPFRLVMLDEMGTFGVSNKTKVALRLRELIDRNIIDQAILIDLALTGYPVEYPFSVIAV